MYFHLSPFIYLNVAYIFQNNIYLKFQQKTKYLGMHFYEQNRRSFFIFIKSPI